ANTSYKKLFPDETTSKVARLSNQFCEQTRERFPRVRTQARVNRRCLHDGAARSSKPTKTLSRRQRANRPGFRAARADALEREEVFFYFRDRQVGGESAEPLFVKLERGLQKVLRGAIKNDAGVQEFFAFDAREVADHGIL